MAKSPSTRKRVTRASSPTGENEILPIPAARQAEPLRVESKSQTGRKRATQAPSPTGQTETPPASAARQTEPLRIEEHGVPMSFSPRREDQRPSSEQIAVHAYHLWLARGKPVGTDWDDWLEAERQLAASA
ncbi:MAG TPA: DUF2934 domain-containing protein [Isosphaeraceae bacterium]|nr:DUF2934 domain-containing protein [Isosphaeraceae bacterium]